MLNNNNNNSSTQLELENANNTTNYDFIRNFWRELRETNSINLPETNSINLPETNYELSSFAESFPLLVDSRGELLE